MLGVLLEMGFSEAVCVKALLLNVYDVLGVSGYIFKCSCRINWLTNVITKRACDRS